MKDPLSRRERQIMDILYRAGRASAAQVQKELHDPPSYSSVRALLKILENKGHIRHETDGARYVFIPKQRPEKARRSALKHLVATFFGGSTEQAFVALLETADDLSAQDFEKLQRMIDQARKEGL
jgi:BlaI family penicillinase repressor